MASLEGTVALVQELVPETRGNLPTPLVLIVDDEALIRWALSEGLVESGYVVKEAATGAAARAAIDDCAGRPLLVLLDLRLPDVSDLSLLAHIREARPDAPVVIMTAHGSSHDATEAARLGAAAFVSKPFDMTMMIDLVASSWATSRLDTH